MLEERFSTILFLRSVGMMEEISSKNNTFCISGLVCNERLRVTWIPLFLTQRSFLFPEGFSNRNNVSIFVLVWFGEFFDFHHL